MSLPPHQLATYWDLADLWRPSRTLASGQREADQVYVLAQSGVPCRFVPKSSVDELLAPIGILGESDDLITVDNIRLPEGTAIESSWIAVNRTVLSTGGNGPYFGKMWVTRGEPKRRISPPGLPAVGRVVAFVSKLTDNAIPTEITAHYE